MLPDFRYFAGTFRQVALVCFEGAGVVEQVELKQLDALVFEIEKGAVDAAPIGTQKAERAGKAANFAFHSRRAPIALPVEPWGGAPLDCRCAAAAARCVLLHFA